ncbi:MAG: hypothetical protein PHI06_15035, partial [Desulfobulbaceae bacterium]|nr:hypothetical protein [Desulfobulbaceae bacterium]
MGFPSVISAEALTLHDFFRFERQFTRTTLDFFPCESVYFISEGPSGQGAERMGNLHASSPTGLSAIVLAGVNLVRQQRKSVVDAEAAVLFLPVWSDADLLVVAVLSGGSRDLYGRYSEDWLLERTRLMIREFSLIKRWAFDPASGVLNATHLR